MGGGGGDNVFGFSFFAHVFSPSFRLSALLSLPKKTKQNLSTFLNAGITDVPWGGMPADVVAVVADVLLMLPLYKHIFAMIGCHPADGKTLARLLKSSSVAINPEGVAGIFHGSSRSDRDHPDLARTERIYLANRKGFVRHAIRAGAPLLPVHHIGASQLLGFTGYPALSRRLRATVGCWWGRYGILFFLF